jgi:hypothetical protein
MHQILSDNFVVRSEDIETGICRNYYPLEIGMNNQVTLAEVASDLGLPVDMQATMKWGCQALSWDTQYRHCVSPELAETTLGPTLEKALASNANSSVITLDSFNQTSRIKSCKP